MKCDLLINDCSYMDENFDIQEHMDIVIRDSKVLQIAKHNEKETPYNAAEIIQGKNKVAMPGLTDGHTHVCQHLLRGRISDEFPMIWTRFLVPFESTLTEEDVFESTQLSCLQMIKSGTTSFADAGGVHMDYAAQAVLRSGLRAALTRSTMDMGNVIPDAMKDTASRCIEKTEDLYKQYDGTGNGQNIIPDIYKEIQTYLNTKDQSPIYGIGLGIPGPVNKDGYVENCVNLGWRHTNPAQELAALLKNIPTAADNDANVAALGECFYGAGKGMENIFMVTLGTGVGGGVSKAGPFLLPMIQKGYDACMFLKRSKAQIRLAKLSGDGGIYGAAKLAMQLQDKQSKN